MMDIPANAKYAIIRETSQRTDNLLSIKQLCSLAGVSRSGYYGWVKAEQARQDREERDKADFQLILNAYRFRGYDKGVQGIHMRLLHTEIRMNPKKIRRLMRKYEFFGPVRKANSYRRLQKAIRTNNTAENLVNREFETHGPRSILLTDITYIPLNGAHYTSVKFVQLVKDGQLHQSMSRRANCWDNAPQESFFGHMKDEIDLSACTCFEQIHAAIRTWAD